MVDMSPEAVSQRLRMMEELWELSVKLGASKSVSNSTHETVAEQIDNATRQDGKPEMVTNEQS